jgi:hypothetical protein
MYLYVIAADKRTIKVGVAGRPLQRLADLQVANPRKLLLVATFKVAGKRVAYGHEAEVHHRLAAWRLEGEWFAVTADEAIAVVTAVISGGAPKTAVAGPVAYEGGRFRPLTLTCPYCSHQSRTKLDRKAIWAGKFRCTQCDRSVPGRRLLVRILSRRIA